MILRRLSMTSRKSEALTGILFASPWILGFIIFTMYPILSSLYFSFTSFNTLSAPEWVGLRNFEVIFGTELFRKSLGNTLYYVVFSIPINLIVSVLLALLLNQKVFGLRLYRTLFYIPNVVSVIAVSFLWQWLLDPTFGPINHFLYMLGIEGPGWLIDEAWSKPSLILMSAWGVGGTIIIFLAALQDVPATLYEAAKIDGANSIVRFWKITIPSISPTLYFNLIMGIVGGFQVFLQAFIMTGGGPAHSSFFYAQYIYQKAFVEFQMGYASALSWILLVIILFVTVIAMKVSDKLVFYMDGQTN